MPNQPVVYLDVKNLAADLTEISELSVEEITANLLDDIGKGIVEKAKQLAPVKTGALRDSISYHVDGDKLTVEVGADYGMYQEFGTGSRGEFSGKPYKIRPKNGKYLKFKVAGRWVYTKEVTHPGVRARPFLRPGVTESLGGLYETLADRGQAMILKGPKSELK